MRKIWITALAAIMMLMVAGCADRTNTEAPDNDGAAVETPEEEDDEDKDGEGESETVTEERPQVYEKYADLPVEIYNDALSDYSTRESKYMNDPETGLYDLEFDGVYLVNGEPGTDGDRLVFMTPYTVYAGVDAFAQYTYMAVYDLDKDHETFKFNEEESDSRVSMTPEEILAEFTVAEKIM